jgi:2-polyprenyl-3-methyl-5-hydroxy-6-metoxy-1,4-benzoquinol methylase
METAEARKIVNKLMDAVWAYDALCFTVKRGILAQLNEPRSLAYLSEHSGVPVSLAESILDILVSVDLVQRDKDIYKVDQGMLPLITEPVKTVFLANILANYFESQDLVNSAVKPTITPGWHHTDAEILQSQGMVSAILTEFFIKGLAPKLGDLGTRLQSPAARFLDIGAGVGALSMAACRFLPNLQVVGLEPQDTPLALARRNIAAAGLTGRIELRQQRVEEMTDTEAFDLAYLPQSFMPEEIVKQGVRNIQRGLRPGGWIMVLVICVPETGLPASISRLRDTLFGGDARCPAQIQTLLNEAGFTAISTFKVPQGETYNITVGQRPI